MFGFDGCVISFEKVVSFCKHHIVFWSFQLLLRAVCELLWKSQQWMEKCAKAIEKNCNIRLEMASFTPVYRLLVGELLVAELLVYLLHFFQNMSDYVLNKILCHYGLKTCIFRSVDNNQSPVRTNEWIKKVKYWSAFTSKQVWKCWKYVHLWQRQRNIVVHS